MTKQDFLSDNVKLRIIDEVAKMTGSATVKVAPELAKVWMRWNVNNRPLSEPKVIFYANQMAAGKWKLNGDPIRFSDEGFLLDGQHRLAAVIMSGATINTDVRFGLESDVFPTIDTGPARTAGDVLSIEKVANYNHHASAIRLIMGMEAGKAQGQTAGKYKLTNESVLEFYRKNRHVTESVSFGEKLYHISGRILSPGEFAAYHYMMSKVNTESADKFLMSLATGASLDVDSPVYRLRALLIKSKIEKIRSMNASYKRAVIIKAWKHYLAGNKLKKLAFDTERETMPKF